MAASRDRTIEVWLSIAATIAILFGLLTIWEGGSVVFLGNAESDAEGNYVPFVVRFNFVAGFAYVTAGFGLWFRRAWAPRLALIIFAATLLVFGAFGLHTVTGGAYETRTVVAMTLRAAVWAAITFLAFKAAEKRNSPKAN